MNKVNQLLVLSLVGQVMAFVGLNLVPSSEGDRYQTSPLSRFDTSKVTKISIAAPINQATFKDNDFTLEKIGEQWTLQDAENYPLEQEKVRGLLSKIKKIRTTELIAESPNYFERLKVADNSFERKITLTNAEQEISFFIGSASGQSKCHFRLSNESKAYLSEGLLPWDVYDVAAGWIKPRFFEIPKEQIWSVALKTKGKPQFEIRKKRNGAWALPNGELVRNRTNLEAVLSKVSQIIIDQPIGKSDKTEYGFSSPIHSLTIQTGTSSISGTLPTKLNLENLTIGAEKMLGTNKAFFARKASSPWIVTIPEWSLYKLNETTFESLVSEEKQSTK